MLARRWNSPELITLDIKAMEAILADDKLVEMQVRRIGEQFKIEGEQAMAR